MKTPVISSQQVFTPDQFNSKSPKERLKEMVNKHLTQLYHKNHLANSYAQSGQELKKRAEDSQLLTNTDFTVAEDEVNNRIDLQGEGCPVSDVVNQFQKPPYGWNAIATLDVLINLAKKGQREFEWNNEELEVKDFPDKALNSRERSSITIRPKSKIDPKKIKAFIEAVNEEIFLEQILRPSDEPKTLIKKFKQKIQNQIQSKVKEFKQDYREYPFSRYLEDYEDKLNELLLTRDTNRLLDDLIDQKEELKNLRDVFGHIDEFTDNQLSAYNKIREFCKENTGNFTYLEKEELDKAKKLKTFALQNEKPWEEFHTYKKAHKEVKKALDEKVKQKQKQVKEKMNRIFDELEERRKELELDANILPSREYKIKEIESISDLGQLELQLHKADQFKNEYMQTLENEKAKENKEYIPSTQIHLAEEVAPRTIETEKQLDEYLQELGDSLRNKLRKNKKLYVN